jgi:oligoribonuclease NrnB/cAMP/cGMP phosphodiesterase (DHH superfamily)
VSDLLDMNKKTICLFHNDPDGCCSAAVVRRALGTSVFLHAMEIGDPVPWNVIEANEQVALVDYSLPTEDMKRLRDKGGFVWVDHHKTSLARLREAMADVPGNRTLDEAACVLTWRTFFPDHPIPRAVELIGDRDIWRMQYPETRAFSEGLYNQDFNPANDALWGPLLDDDAYHVQALVDRGAVLYEYRMRTIEGSIERYSFETTFEGHRTLAVNHRGSGDMGEHIRNLGYEVGYCYVDAVRDGSLKTHVTLYSDQIDVSELARKHGGGGHRGAAGFQFVRSGRPFPEGSESN